MPYNHHNIFLNAEYEKQNLDHKELEDTIYKVKESVNKLKNTASADLIREKEALESSIAQATETAHQELQDSVNEINQNIDAITGQFDTDVTAVNHRVDNAVITLNSAVNAAESRINTRVDNIIANSPQTEGNSELIDIRTGADGTVHSSAGTAVRQQISDISSEITSLQKHFATVNILDPTQVYTEKYFRFSIGNPLATSASKEILSI